MNYVIFNADGSVLAQNLEYYIQQGNSGDEIFIGFADALATDTTIAVFTLPNQDQDTNTVAGVYGSETIEIEGVSNTYNGWTITLTLAQTTYNGLLTMAIRIIRDSQIIVSYPIALVINETGVMPNADSGVTIEELNSYLLQLQQVAIGCIRYYTFDTANDDLQDIADKVGIGRVFAMSFGDDISICHLEEGSVGYVLVANNPYGIYYTEDLVATTKLDSLTWETTFASNNVIEKAIAPTGTFTQDELRRIKQDNVYIKDIGVSTPRYYRLVEKDNSNAYFQWLQITKGSDHINCYVYAFTVNLSTGFWSLNASISHEYYTSTQVDNKLALKENLSNKVTSISNTSTDTQYPSAKCVYDNFVNVREVAEGKCKTIVISYADNLTLVKNSISHGLVVYDKDGNDISQDITDGDYDNVTIDNNKFNNQNNGIYLTNDGYLIIRSYNGAPSLTNSAMLAKYSDILKIGDIVLVIETDVPDRWFSDYYNTFYKLETSKIDLTNYVDLSSAQTITGVKTFYSDTLNFKANANANNIWSIEITDYLFNIKRAGASWVNFSDNSFIFGRSLRPDGNGTRDLGTSTGPYYWKDLYLSGKIYFGTYDWIKQENDSLSLGYDQTQMLVMNKYYNIKSRDLLPIVNTNCLGGANDKWQDLYLSGSLYGATYNFTIDSAYGILYGKTINNLPILEYENKNVITTSVGTSITLRAAKTGCLPIYEGFITNLSGSAISFGFPNSLTLLTNDEDNVSVSGSILTIGAGITIEFSLCDNKLVAINWAI